MSLIGILFALLACACWGLSMICPVLAPNFTALEVTLGRYLFYGLLSLGLWLLSYCRERKTHPWPVWKMAFLFACTGNVVYYALEVIGVKMIGPSMVALLFAINPIFVTLYGNLKQKEIPYSMIILPIVLVGFGIFFVHAHDLTIKAETSPIEFWSGVAITLMSISMWAWYAVNNSGYLKKQQALTATDFNVMIGVWCFVLALIGMGGLSIFRPDSLTLFSPDLTSADYSWFLAATLLLGIFGSFFGSFFWLKASKMLPVTLAGQIIVAETCFGLLYTYIHEFRFPGIYECLGFALAIGGVLISIRRIQQHKAKVFAA